MRPGAASTIVLVTSSHVARADFAGGLRSARRAARPAGASTVDAVRAALALGGKAARETWVLCSDVWIQKVSLNPTQVAGLSPAQLTRALSFEVEPFSGIPVGESATGYHEEGAGEFSVAEIAIAFRDSIQRMVADTGGKLAGITNPGAVPDDDAALLKWWPEWPPKFASKAVPLIIPPAPAPSRHRFMAFGIVLEAAAVALLFLIAGWQAIERKNYEDRFAALTSAARDLDAANKQNDGLRKRIAALDKEDKQREQVHLRRGALLALMDTLAATRPEDVVVRGLTAEGSSSVVVSGISLEAGAVDELSIALTQKLATAGWAAQPRSKTGKKNLPNGGPWEFALVVTHEEAARSQALQAGHRETK